MSGLENNWGGEGQAYTDISGTFTISSVIKMSMFRCIIYSNKLMLFIFKANNISDDSKIASFG